MAKELDPGAALAHKSVVEGEDSLLGLFFAMHGCR